MAVVLQLESQIRNKLKLEQTLFNECIVAVQRVAGGYAVSIGYTGPP